MIVNIRFQMSHSIYNSWQYQPRDDGLLDWWQMWSDSKAEQEDVVIFAHILYLKLERVGGAGEDLNAATESPISY